MSMSKCSIGVVWERAANAAGNSCETQVRNPPIPIRDSSYAMHRIHNLSISQALPDFINAELKGKFDCAVQTRFVNQK